MTVWQLWKFLLGRIIHGQAKAPVYTLLYSEDDATNTLLDLLNTRKHGWLIGSTDWQFESNAGIPHGFVTLVGEQELG